MSRWLQAKLSSNAVTIVLFGMFFALLFSRTIRGVGQYWDWVFPYYSDQIANFFNRASAAWTNDSMGSPLSYTSDYFFRFFVSLFRGLPPELVLYGLLVITFTAGAFGVYLIAKRRTKSGLAFVLGLAAFVNPTVFYNFTAGYVDYLVAYSFFIYLVHFLLYRYRPQLRSAVIGGLLLAAVGVQLQFFAIAGLLIVLFFVFRKQDWRWRDGIAWVMIPLLVSLVWLSNFIFGGASLADTSQTAAKGAFMGLSDTQYLDIFNFAFSKATLISRFYSIYELLLCGFFFVLVIVVLMRTRRKETDDVGLFSFLLIMLFLATGLFQAINLGPLTMFYPMFREVGHFAPVVVLILIVLLGRLMPRGVTRWLCFGWLVVVVTINFATYQRNPQAIPFAAVRQEFTEFKQFSDTHPDADQRVLAYPFWDQYSFTHLPQSFQNNLPLRNSGHDSFATFSSSQFIKAAVKPQDVKSSVQYRLEQTLDVDVLRPYNVRYIYDLSGVYESYYDRYVAPNVYDNDLSLVKNNPYFLDELLTANPGKLKRVSPYILEITDYAPRVGTAGTVYAVPSADAGEAARSFMESTFGQDAYHYVVSANKTLPPAGSVTPLFTDPTQPGLLNSAAQSLEQTVVLPSGTGKAQVYASAAPSTITYQAARGSVVFYGSQAGQLSVNGQPFQSNQAATVVGRLNMIAGHRYFAAVDNTTLVQLPFDGSGTLGKTDANSPLELYATVGRNLISNPSFESGLWQPQAGDCHNYDEQPQIAMNLDATTASDGHQSLELLAQHHDACTSTTMPLTSRQMYLLSYDYQSPNAQTASFYLRFNNSDENSLKGFQGIGDTDWHTMRQLFEAPDDATIGQLQVHAIGSDQSTPTVNRYDNFDLEPLQDLGQLQAPTAANAYQAYDLPANQPLHFKFSDSSLDYRNVIGNGSFEQGPWQPQVTDCNNRDANGKIAASLSAEHTDGSHSLQLEATRHIACEYSNAVVQPGTDYLLSFDYQGDGNGQAGYYAEFTGAGQGQEERIDIADKQWHTFTTTVHVPDQVSSLRLYLHAYETNGTTNTVARFDNVTMTAIPSVENRFYVVGSPSASAVRPQHVTFKTVDTTRRQVHVDGAREPFVLDMSESYHAGWRLELDNAAASSWLPNAAVSALGVHFELDNYLNAWYIDPAAACAQASAGCVRHADGSYDLSLVIEFVPQRWFVVSRAISIVTLVLTAGYLLITTRRHRDTEGYYYDAALKTHRLRK